jgi:amino acid permease
MGGMKDKIVKNIGNAGLLIFALGAWFDAIFKTKPDDRAISAVSIVLMAVGAAMAAAHIVMWQRAKKAQKQEDGKEK